MFFSPKKQKIINVMFFLIFTLTICAIPVSKSQIQKAHAAEVIVANTSIQAAIDNTLNKLQTAFQSEQRFKEMVLDPIMWRLANKMITSMLTDLTRWVNSGFEGSPAFITDLEGFLINVADQAAGDFIESEGLGFLCSPFKLDVKIALNIQYQQSKRTAQTQCTLTGIVNNMENFLNGTFSEGGWAGWFELTQGPTNDPNKAFLEARTQLGIRLTSARGVEFERAISNNFFKDIKSCKTVETKDGPKEQCVTSTPGKLVQDQFNSTLDASKQRLVFADEFDELVGALLAQFSNQAITGLNGLLGLGGTSYSNNSYGSGGNKSYLDAVVEENNNENNDGGTDAIEEVLDTAYEYLSLQQRITRMINNVEEDLESARDEYGSCFNVRMSPVLTDARDISVLGERVAQLEIEILEDLVRQYEAAETVEEEVAIIDQFNDLRNEGLASNDLNIFEAELDIEYRLPPDINSLQSQISAERSRCERLQPSDNSAPSGVGDQ